jgi:hypothetical protein
VWDVENDVAYEPSRIHRIDFEGQFHRLSATQQTHPSRQRVPVLFQAGSSKAGIALAGAHAEGLYCGSMVPSHTAKYVENIRASAAAAGRDPRSVKAFAGISLFLGRTTEEAQAKYDAAAKNVSPIAGLAKFGGYTNVDMSKYPLDEQFEFTANPGSADNVIQGIITNFKAGDGSTETWTPRKLGSKIALGGLYPIFIGTAEQVADSMEDWVAKTDIDGFNLYCKYLPIIITRHHICSAAKYRPAQPKLTKRCAQIVRIQRRTRTSWRCWCRNCNVAASTGWTIPCPVARSGRTCTLVKHRPDFLMITLLARSAWPGRRRGSSMMGRGGRRRRQHPS